MSIVTLEQAKQFLRITHQHDDVNIQQIIDAAVDEAIQYTERTDWAACNGECDQPSECSAIPESFKLGVLLLVQASYSGATPDDQAKLRAIAETKLTPHRLGLGI